MLLRVWLSCDIGLEINIYVLYRLCFVFCLFNSISNISKENERERIKVSRSNYDNLRIKYRVFSAFTDAAAVSAQITLRSECRSVVVYLYLNYTH